MRTSNRQTRLSALAQGLLRWGVMLSQVAPIFDPVIDVLMTRRPITIGQAESIDVAASLMRTCRIRHLPVVDRKLIGVLSLRDIIAAKDGALVADVMKPAPEVIGPSQPLTMACERMLAHRVSCLPVVDGDQLVGIFTATDALRFAVAALEDDSRAQGREPEVSQLMTARPLVLVSPTETLAGAWNQMCASSVRHLPVMNGDTIVGLLSDRDVLAAGREWIGDDSELGRRTMLVADAMSTRVSTIGADRPAVEAARTLLRRRVGALPVLRGRELRGILTVSDFMYWLLARA